MLFIFSIVSAVRVISLTSSLVAMRIVGEVNQTNSADTLPLRITDHMPYLYINLKRECFFIDFLA